VLPRVSYEFFNHRELAHQPSLWGNQTWLIGPVPRSIGACPKFGTNGVSTHSIDGIDYEQLATLLSSRDIGYTAREYESKWHSGDVLTPGHHRKLRAGVLFVERRSECTATGWQRLAAPNSSAKLVSGSVGYEAAIRRPQVVRHRP
ncbi:MAG: hypothetical protein AAGF97_02810, partial [Planctomycetota bacterium]